MSLALISLALLNTALLIYGASRESFALIVSTFIWPALALAAIVNIVW